MDDEYRIIEDGRKFVVIDERGELKFVSYWHQECREYIDRKAYEWNDEDDY